MRTVLIVSPHFPPTNAADHHRVRMACSYLPQFGWNPIVLAVKPEFVEQPRDEWLLKTLPSNLEVHRVNAIPVSVAKWVGMRTIAHRCRSTLRRAGGQILSRTAVDLIYFSTTQVGVQRLGPEWLKNFQRPFLFDLQDPWVNTYYAEHPEVRPPGGRVKFALAQRQAVRDERRCVEQASAITSVSQRYLDDLARRYPKVDSSRWHVLPFGASERDLELSRESPVAQNSIAFDDGLEHWISIGRGGQDMHPAARTLFRGFKLALQSDPSRFQRVRMHFLGTDYAAAELARQSIRPVAVEEGIGEFVDEQPQRIPYSEALACMTQADRLMVLGSNDAGYNPSKIAPYLFSRKPLIAILHDSSPAIAVLNAARERCFVIGDDLVDIAPSLAAFLIAPQSSPGHAPEALDEMSARQITERLARIFDSCVIAQR